MEALVHEPGARIGGGQHVDQRKDLRIIGGCQTLHGQGDGPDISGWSVRTADALRELALAIMRIHPAQNEAARVLVNRIEVLVSFVVLAIVGGALLQTFVSSTKINRRAYDTDKASALVVQVQD